MASDKKETPDHHDQHQQGEKRSENSAAQTIARGLAKLERRTMAKRNQYGVMTGGLASGSATEALGWAKKVHTGVSLLQISFINEFRTTTHPEKAELLGFIEQYRFDPDFISADPEDSAVITLERLQKELIQWIKNDFPLESSPETWFL
jgi:hypothetical protein